MVDGGGAPRGEVPLGIGRGEVERYGRDLAGGEDASERTGAARQDECVGQTVLDDALRRVGDADGLDVHADEEVLRRATGALGEKGALAAAEVEVDRVKVCPARMSGP